jgi:hypothetical protein
MVVEIYLGDVADYLLAAARAPSPCGSGTLRFRTALTDIG